MSLAHTHYHRNMASDYQRRIIGKQVYAKALHVTALEECARRYGSWSKSKEVTGTGIELIGKKTRNNRSSIYVKAVYTLGGGTWETVQLNIRSVLKALNDTQYFVPDILQYAGETLGPTVPPIPTPEVTDNADDNSVVDLCQPISIPDTIDVMNVPGVATVAVPEAAPNVAPKAAVPQVSSATGEDSGTNTNTSQETDPLGTSTVVAHDTKWYK